MAPDRPLRVCRQAPSRAGSDATLRRRRLLAFAITALVVLALRSAAPDPATRRAWAVLGMLPLGYGHQLAALWLGRRTGGRRVTLLGGAAFSSAAAGFEWLLAGPAAATLLGGLAIFSLWHVVENELALPRAVAQGRLRLPPLSPSARQHARPVLWTVVLLAVVLGLPRLGPTALRLGLAGEWGIWTAEELIAIPLFHHVVTFLVHGLLPEEGESVWWVRRRRRVVLAHLLPLGIGFALDAWRPGLFAVLASPPLYLFCSVAHAVQTLGARGLAPR
jgi:hypothetical protein